MNFTVQKQIISCKVIHKELQCDIEHKNGQNKKKKKNRFVRDFLHGFKRLKEINLGAKFHWKLHFFMAILKLRISHTTNAFRTKVPLETSWEVYIKK